MALDDESSSEHSKPPLLKRKDRSWDSSPLSLAAPISPPSYSRRQPTRLHQDEGTLHRSVQRETKETFSLAAIEAGEVEIEDHLLHFSRRLSQVVRSDSSSRTSLPIPELVDLYKRNQQPHGRNFVIHQHDHPVAGVHYDLRLQFSESSSISFAIMYGLPGDPNSRRLNRNATETRVHNLWNHLIETASSATGSLLIWDVGEYEILPYYPAISSTSSMPSDVSSDSSEPSTSSASLHENEKLIEAFHKRKIRVRLHGTRLPPGYTVSLRLSRDNDLSKNPTSQSKPQVKKGRRRQPQGANTVDQAQPPSTPSPSSPSSPSPTSPSRPPESPSAVTQDEIRSTNAYPGATNSIGSIHQRRWYLSLDRASSGFRRERGRKKGDWVPKQVLEQSSSIIKDNTIKTPPDDNDNNAKSKNIRRKASPQGFAPFQVLGPDHERSVITNRLAADVMADEGVQGWVPRKGWRAVTE
ncbi:MAG: hypothetical protein M1837_000509 [Sclerophora amabilis]|nr:MAG: hypothetical protein M1837_000509 [Sclerophora amabilis]